MSPSPKKAGQRFALAQQPAAGSAVLVSAVANLQLGEGLRARGLPPSGRPGSTKAERRAGTTARAGKKTVGQ